MKDVATLNSVNCCTFYFIIDWDVPIHLSVILREKYYQIKGNRWM